MSAAASTPTRRYRFISPWAYVAGPVALAAAVRFSIPLAIGVFVVLTGLVAVLLRIGSDISADGVTARTITSSTFVPWSDITAVQTEVNWNVGQRIVLICRDGRRIVLPAPTSKTRGLVAAHAAIVAHTR